MQEGEIRISLGTATQHAVIKRDGNVQRISVDEALKLMEKK